MRPHVGPRTPFGAAISQISKDSSQLQEIMMIHQLAAVNTRSARKPCAYQRVDKKTVIDYIIMRTDQARGPAKNAKPIHDDMLQRWRDSKHSPVVADVLATRLLPSGRSDGRSPAFDLPRRKASMSQGTVTMDIPAAVQASIGDITRENYKLHNQQLLQLCHTHYPIQQVSRVPNSNPRAFAIELQPCGLGIVPRKA